LPDEAADYWKRNAPTCEKLGTLTDADRDTFTLLCLTWARLVACEANSGSVHEYVCLAKQYQNLCKSFGLDPLSRKKLGVSIEEDVKDEFGI
jgi:phage terminase small subunit